MNFFLEGMKNCRMAIITTYYGTKDYPNKYVARLFDINRPTNYICVCDTYEEILEQIPSCMVSFGKHKDDVPSIIEVFI